MFWGFVLEPKKRYNTTVTKPFHISMAALDPKSINDNDISSLVLNVDGTETILCNLGKPNYLQERLDLNFIEGNTITLEVKGKAIVHLSGYFIYEQDGMDDEDDSEFDGEEEDDLDDEDEENDTNATRKALKALKKQMSKKSKFNASTTEEDSDEDDDDESMDVSDLTFDDDDDSDEDDEDDEDGEEDDDEEDDDSEEEQVKVASPGSTPMPPQKKNKGNTANNTPVSANKKKQQQQQQQESGKKNKGDKQSPQKQQQQPMTNGNSTPGSAKKKNKNKENGSAPGTPNNTTPNSKQGDGKTPKKNLEGGVIVEDIKVGQGVPAKSGKMISVYYSGKLKSNNKQFDSSTSGPGFKFRLGKGEVIKGWDVGLNGMKVGGKRRITIPAHMAYGNKGSPPAIPPNSTLVFDVELKNVN